MLVEVNLGEEPQKGGARPDEVKALLDAIAGLGRVRVRGLMAIPPAAADPEATRPHFRRLRELRDLAGLEHLSMGMSADYAVAVEEGATIVRVGTAIFGPRAPRADRVTIKGKRVGFLGAGNMGEAMIKGLTQAGLVPAASIGATDARAGSPRSDDEAIRHPRRSRTIPPSSPSRT